jgi:hypothetical protein
MECPECGQMRAESERLERLYASAAEALDRGLRLAGVSEYRRLMAAHEKAAASLKTVRLNFERHFRTDDNPTEQTET